MSGALPQPHCWHPIHEGVTPTTLDVETGEVHRVVTHTRPENFRFRQRCGRCKATRERTWGYKPAPCGCPGEVVLAETTPDPGPCSS